MKEEIFDSFIRETLENAEVKAPKGVWAAVSRRMGVPQRRHVWPVYAAVAGVCAAVAAFFYLEPSSEAVPGFDRAVLESQPELFSLAVIPESPAALKALSVRTISGQVVEVSDGEELVVEESPVAEEQIPEKAGEYTVMSREDPFAAMMAEDERADIPEEPVSIKFGGVVGANDSHSAARSRRPAWASGYVPDGLKQSSVSTFHVPVSFGISAKIPVANNFAVGVGLSWTTLNRSFEGSFNTAEGEFNHRVDYVGIPVELYYNLIRRSSLQIYAFAGASLEKAVSSRYYIHSQSSLPLVSERFDGVQFGVRTGLGIAFTVARWVSFYFDPYVGYYIPSNQPLSLRTEHPLMVSFEAGLRFDL